MDANLLVGKCTDCGKMFPLEELKCLPEAAEYCRNLARKTATVEDAKNIDMDTYLCPHCMEKRIASNK